MFRKLTVSSMTLVLVSAVVTLLAAGCNRQSEPAQEGTAEQAAGGGQAQTAQQTDPRDSGLFAPLPTTVDVNEAKAQLGNRLYHDTGLSIDGTLSCASCHDIQEGGDDGRPVSIGVGGQQGPINAPTVLNSSLFVAQFWDGRAADLQEQAAGPINNPGEMGSNWEHVVDYLGSDQSYVEAFGAVYDDGITADNVTDAIAEFERTLITPNSRFDQYLLGNDDALTDEEKAGFQTFVDVGCGACHNGPALGGNTFQRMGAVNDYFADRGNLTEVDNGRFNVTGDEADMHKFKVPTLRNIELTAPYFHDASAATLDEAVRTMSHYQLGQELTDEQVRQIVAFLRTLTGQIPNM